MNKKTLSERDICTKFITPALVRAGWDVQGQIREEVSFTRGRVTVRGKLAVRGEQKRADYVLYYKPNLPLLVLEAKDNHASLGGGLPQALGYAEDLDVPFAVSSNGDGFLFHDRTGLAPETEVELPLDRFPSPSELWRRYCAWKKIPPEAERVVAWPYHDDGSGRAPRYYQQTAINRAVEAVARGQRRALLVMATGTGKTYTAFQIIWRLWKSGLVKRTLFLADRNILVDQAQRKDFKAFGSVMTKVQHRAVDKSFEVYLALYQAVSGPEADQNIYRQFSPDFFDLVVVDECHRGSAQADSAWREILTWFTGAVQLGLTATPLPVDDEIPSPTYQYFKAPIFTYSLKQGIDDGFLAPFKVIRVGLDRDLEGWRPTRNQRDDHGQLVPDRVYDGRDMDTVLILDQRTRAVARKIMDYMGATDPYGKTIVFCEDIDHAERMRSALQNEVGRRYKREASNRHFVARITGDNVEAPEALDRFIHPEERYPVIATTSKLLTTGVDAETCKLIVLDQRIESMTEFKQIIGRGTRIREDMGKLWFTIMDFKKATQLFADPAFDGDPELIFESEPDSLPVPPELPGEEEGAPPDLLEEPEPRERYHLRGVGVKIAVEIHQVFGPDGKLITETLTDYTRTAVQQKYATLGDFFRRWSESERKQAVLDELRAQGVPLEDLAEEVGLHLDPFDLICHVVYGQPPLTRRERADQVRKRDVFTRYGPQARAVLDALLEKYADEGIEPVEQLEVLRVPPLSAMGTPIELLKRFGGRDAFVQAVRALEDELYRAS